MLTPDQINTIHRLHSVEKWSLRKIAAHLHIGRRTIVKYLETPVPQPTRRDRASKLDPFKPAVAELLEQDLAAHAPVVTQRLRTLGYDGGETIVKDHLRALRAESKARRAYVRVEPGPGERFDIDWGHFGALTYNGAARKLYAFCLVEAHSRRMYLEFTHSQTVETFVRCHLHAFDDFGGCARELWFDNLATAVAEHEGNLVRFNPRFLGFAREYGFIPRACHVAAAWEKGKVERAIGYIRQNFWPLWTFTDLTDVNAQARRWVQDTANQRKHRETGQAPAERFQPEFLRPVPLLAPDYRDTAEALVHKDLRLSFDGSRCCAPPRYVGHKLTVKLTPALLSSTISPKRSPLMHAHGSVAAFSEPSGSTRSCSRKWRQHSARLRNSASFACSDPHREYYLRKLTETDRSLAGRFVSFWN